MLLVINDIRRDAEDDRRVFGPRLRYAGGNFGVPHTCIVFVAL